MKEWRALIAIAAFLAAALGLAPWIPRTASSAWAADETAPSTRDWYVAEIIDTVYSVGPAEFFALDLPTNPEGSEAVHLSGTITIADRKGDIIVRVFRAADYKGWLKKRDLKESNPLWSSKRSRNISVDLDLPHGTPIILLLDNGYSIRNSKRVRCQLQMQYERVGDASGEPSMSGSGSRPATPAEDDLVTPRSNTEEEAPPPPPPPPPSDEETK